jgi:tetratricopeptide (TPR) repeat protein
MNGNPTSSGKVVEPREPGSALADAVALVEAGRFEEAVAAMELDPEALKTPRGLNLLGDIRLKQGDPRRALQAFDAAIRLAPSSAEALSNRAAALRAMGRLKDALAAVDRALRYRPGHGPAHFNRGNILLAQGRPEAAIAEYDRALKQKRVPTAEIRLNRGLALAARNRLIEALADFRQAQQLKPALADAYLGHANVLARLGRQKEALAVLGAGLAVAPESSELLGLQSNLLAKDRPADALAATERALEHNPEDASALAARATALRKLKRFDDALAAADAAVRLTPSDHRGHIERGLVLGEMGRYADQLEALQTAEGLGGASSLLYDARGFALSQLGKPSAALAAYERAIEADPTNASAHTHYSYQLLAVGDFDRGWAEYEWRLKAPDYVPASVRDLAPPWRGEIAPGERILIVSEQGIGDCIQFLRFLPLVARSGAKITLTVPPPLLRMIQRAFPQIDVTAARGLRTQFDYQTGLLSLPYVLKTGSETLPGSLPYLYPDDSLVAKWRHRLGSEGYKVAIAWQGNPTYPGDRWRSVPLRLFEPLAAIPGVRLISVQAINGLDQLDTLPTGMKVESFGAEIGGNPDGFEEIAAIMANVDLVISSDTAVVHLAGGLGRPTWVALSRMPDWRWQAEGADSPWYPSFRLFRQRQHGQWQAVFAEMAAVLGRAVSERD